MEVPKRILVDFKELNVKERPHAPADLYSDSDDDYDYEPDRYSPAHIKIESTATLMTPPGKLTIPEISDEERRRYMRDTSLGATDANGILADDTMYKTPNETVLRNINSFQSGDPVSLARQVRHLHNRVKLLEEELQTQHSRQIFIFGILSVYMVTKGIKWMCH